MSLPPLPAGLHLLPVVWDAAHHDEHPNARPSGAMRTLPLACPQAALPRTLSCLLILHVAGPLR